MTLAAPVKRAPAQRVLSALQVQATAECAATQLGA